MIPTTIEFNILYIAYAVMFVFLAYNLLSAEHKKFYKWNALCFAIYSLIMLYVLLDSTNLRYGNSLGVLFFGAIFVLTHVVIMGCIKLYNTSKLKKTSTSTDVQN